MKRQIEVQESYKRGAKRYDDLLATQTWWAKLGCRVVWGFEDTAYAPRLLRWLPDTYEGKLLDVPVGTALFTAEKYVRKSVKFQGIIVFRRQLIIKIPKMNLHYLS